MQKVILGLAALLTSFAALSADIWDEIRTTALAPNNGTNGRALPLAGGWQSGWYKYNWGDNRGGTLLEPSYIIQLIEKQHHLLVNIAHRGPDEAVTYYSDYMENALDYLEQKNQPIVVGGTQYEQNLYLKEPYISLPYSTSPRVYTTAQELLNKLTPFPPVLSKWYDVGTNWIDGSAGMDMLQSIYPNPPKVIFLGNNESQRLKWSEAETSQRYIDLYGTGQTDNFKRQKFSEGWAECYAEMFNGMRAGLNTNWNNNSIFVGYLCSGMWNGFGRWSGWPAYSLHYNSEIAWEQNVWDGCSTSYYLHSAADGPSDFRVYGMQVELQNRVFMLEDQLTDNPDYWHELSVWYGGDEHRDWLVNTLGQTYDGARYKGMIQFGMWLLTPRFVRHFNGWTVSREAEGFEYFDAVMDAVDRVHTDPILKKFWQYGELVENTSRSHPSQTLIPTEFANRHRWFQLNTSLDPATPWTLYTEIPVFSIARVIGTTPNREWLVYAHSPLQERTGVEITLPGYGTVTTDVSREGTFVHVKENDNDLIAYYSLNDTANDLSGNGNNGTLVNSPSYDTGKINNGIALVRASAQYVNCGNASILSSAMDELTVCAWVNADTLQAEGIDWVVGKGSLLSPNVGGYHLRAWHKQIAFFVGGSDGNAVCVNGPALQENTWYHITGVFKGGEYMKLYVNGTEYSKTTGVPAAIAASSNYDLQIGRGSYCSYPWDGIIDDVKVFNRALSADEVTDQAHRLLYLYFEQITSGSIADLSGHGNTGTTVNSPSLSRERIGGNNAVQLVKSSSQYVNCGNDSSLDSADELTIDVWAKADTLQADGIDWVLGKGSLYYTPKSGYSLRCYHKQLAFFVVGPNDTVVSVTGPVLEEDVWYHIVGVFKSGQYLKLYVNGTEYSNTSNIPASIVASGSYDLHIGNGSYCSYPWDGVIDEVKIYNKALY